MRCFRPLLFLGLIPVLAILLSAPGCGKGKKTADDGGDLSDFGDGSGKDSAKPAKTEVPSMGYAELSGLVTYEGERPKVGTLRPEMEKHNDAKQCLMGKEDEISEQTWIVGQNKGVANVVIFLKVPKGKYFKIEDKDKTVKDPVELHQPHCAFLPHVVALYPVYYDPAKKEYVETGQRLKVFNDARMSHNTKISGDPAENPPENQTLLPDSDKSLLFKPQPKPLEIACNFHTWMSAKAWVFDNPYHAVTKGQGKNDKEADFGKYEIARVPAGVEVDVVAWHPGAGFIWGPDGKKMTFKADEKRTENFQVKQK